MKGEGTGFGMVMRDENGAFLRAATRWEKDCWPPEIAEMKAVEFGLRQLEMSGHGRAIVEMDCRGVATALQKTNQTRLEGWLVIRDLQAEAQRLDTISWSFIKRAGNNSAHIMAHTPCNWKTQEIWESRPPIFLLYVLAKERKPKCLQN
ncbi:unnamed protein product [Linum trigynum]|uniref:RNase H type-1 domain-containing protein n=1 Tax=Linum trigynum TaxID=586398 RepID=A0AAV2CEB6_9ROSI